ncbi:MAG: hypothetical protein J6M18_05365 [Actinomycetaceae bacterium]|nr:hypothetical protein [Actinomycetaceae bacterium]
MIDDKNSNKPQESDFNENTASNKTKKKNKKKKDEDSHHDCFSCIGDIADLIFDFINPLK